ncbi:MAG: ferredoxin--NADP reductase [Deltaproteobacteria bacterium]|nr:ferredoxin--NADP reductase [Deltaproteobacteria bacterium]
MGLAPEEIKTLREKFYNAALIELFEPQKDLWIFRVKPDKGQVPFKPGQYTTLGLGIWESCVAGNGPEALKPGQEKQLLRRAYSVSHPVVNSKTGDLYSPSEIDFYEFYVTLVVNESSTPTSPRLTPRIFALKKGDRLSFGPKMTGHYNLDGIQKTDQILLFATGTGEAPHNAMVWQMLTEKHEGPIVSVVCTRYAKDQAYRGLHEKLAKEHKNYHVIYMATREPSQPKLYPQDLITRGLLEKQSGMTLDAAKTHVYLCGNPSMIGRPEVKEGQKIYPKPAGLIEILENKGFTVSAPGRPGNIHFEAYW